jgi:hypothetical protein
MLQILLIDELTNNEIKKCVEYLNLNTIKSPIEGLYWLNIPYHILTIEQNKLLKDNIKFKIAIEITKKLIKFELLIRTETLDNFGGGNLTNKQFKYIYNFYNNLYIYLKNR